MGRQRKAKLEVEYELERQINDLKQENAKLKRRLRELEKINKENKESKDETIPKPPQVKKCPNCGAKLKEFQLPTGILELCESACGYRNVNQTKK